MSNVRIVAETKIDLREVYQKEKTEYRFVADNLINDVKKILPKPQVSGIPANHSSKYEKFNNKVSGQIQKYQNAATADDEREEILASLNNSIQEFFEQLDNTTRAAEYKKNLSPLLLKIKELNTLSHKLFRTANKLIPNLLLEIQTLKSSNQLQKNEKDKLETKLEVMVGEQRRTTLQVTNGISNNIRTPDDRATMGGKSNNNSQSKQPNLFRPPRPSVIEVEKTALDCLTARLCTMYQDDEASVKKGVATGQIRAKIIDDLITLSKATSAIDQDKIISAHLVSELILSTRSIKDILDAYIQDSNISSDLRSGLAEIMTKNKAYTAAVEGELPVTTNEAALKALSVIARGFYLKSFDTMTDAVRKQDNEKRYSKCFTYFPAEYCNTTKEDKGEQSIAQAFYEYYKKSNEIFMSNQKNKNKR